MHIVKFRAENIKRLKVVEFTPDPTLNVISGPNEAGKSAVLDAISMSLEGGRALPERPIRDGEEAARTSFVLSDGTRFGRTFSDTGTTALTVRPPVGQAKVTRHQEWADQQVGQLTLHPEALITMTAKEQRSVLARLVGIEEMLDILDEEDRADYQQRTDLNRQIKKLEAVVESLPALAPATRVDVADTMQQISEARAHNARHAEAIARADSARVRAAAKREDVQRLLAEIEQLDREAVPPAESAPVDVSPLEQRLAQAQVINQQASDYEAAEAKRHDLVTLTAEADHLTDRMWAREARRRATVEACTMPIAGLGFGETGITFHGVPLAQVSSGRQIVIAAAIAMAGDPPLKLLLVRLTSLLDTDLQQEIVDMARTRHWQVFFEIVSEDDTDGIVIEAGEVVKINPPRDPKDRQRVVAHTQPDPFDLPAPVRPTPDPFDLDADDPFA